MASAKPSTAPKARTENRKPMTLKSIHLPHGNKPE
jgi:hypothetical protein